MLILVPVLGFGTNAIYGCGVRLIPGLLKHQPANLLAELNVAQPAESTPAVHCFQVIIRSMSRAWVRSHSRMAIAGSAVTISPTCRSHPDASQGKN